MARHYKMLMRCLLFVLIIFLFSHIMDLKYINIMYAVKITYIFFDKNILWPVEVL